MKISSVFADFLESMDFTRRGRDKNEVCISLGQLKEA
jgi:hypothetical protein